MATRLEMILEAKKRGLKLSPNDDALFTEAMKRGLVDRSLLNPEQRVSEEEAEERRTVAPEERTRRLIQGEQERPSVTPPIVGGGMMGMSPEGPEDPGGKALLPFMLGMGLPAGGAAIGGRLMQAAPRFGATLGEMLGSVAARQGNIALGEEEPGRVGDAISIGAPVAARGLGAVTRRLSGVSAARHELGAEEARALPGMIRPATPSKDLYQRVAQINPPISTPNLRQAADDLAFKETRIAGGLKSGEIKGITEGLMEATAQGGMSFNDLNHNLQRVGEVIRRHRAEGGEVYGAARRLYAAIHKDMEQAASSGLGGPKGAYEALKQATKAARKEFAAEDLAEIIEKGITDHRQGDALTSVAGSKILNKFKTELRTDDLFAGSFTPNELQRIENVLTDLTRIPPLPSVGNYGSGQHIQRAGIVSAAGWVLGLDPGQIMAVGGATAGVPYILGRALVTGPGRAIVGGLIRSGRLLKPEGIAALTGFLRTTGQIEMDDQSTQ